MPVRRWLPAILFAALVTAQASVDAGQEETARGRQAYERAIQLEGEGNYAAALSLLWEASGLAPRDAEVQNRLGEALERVGALDAAVDAYRRAIAERPAFRKASSNLILALVKTGKGPEAVERARALVAESPGDPDRYFTLGLAQSEQDIDAAIQAFRKALELAPRQYAGALQPGARPQAGGSTAGGARRARARGRDRAAAGTALHDGHHLLAPGRPGSRGGRPPRGSCGRAEVCRCARCARRRAESHARLERRRSLPAACDCPAAGSCRPRTIRSGWCFS